jgi:transposase
MLCRHVYNAAIGERRKAWRSRSISVTCYQQKVELPGIKEAMPEYAEIHSQVLQDVAQRVDRAFTAFFRRIREGETPGYPRFHGRDRYNSFTYPQVGEHGGAGRRHPQLVEARTYQHSPAPPTRRHAQDPHDSPGSGRLVRLYYPRGCADTAIASDWTGDRN